MNKKINILISLIVFALSFVGIYSIVNYEKNNTSVQELTLLEEKDSKIINEVNIKLSVVEVIIIFILIILFIVSIIDIIFIIKKVNIMEYIKNYIFILSVIISSIIICGIFVYIVNNKIYVNVSVKDRPVESYVISPKASFTFDKDSTESNKRYNSYESDTNSVLVKGGIVNLNGCSIYKQGNTLNDVVSELYGINSGILVLKESNVYLKNSTINTYATGGIGVVSVLKNSKANLDMVTIDTTGEFSPALLASISGTITADSIKIKTSSANSPAVSSVRSGVVNVTSAVIETNASSSPIIKTSGKIYMYNSIGDSNASGLVYIDGLSEVTIDSSELRATGNKNSNDDLDGGIVINGKNYKKDYKNNTTININDSKLEIKKQSKIYNKVPMIVVSNDNAIINISESELVYGSNEFLNINNSNKNNSILVKLNINKQKLNGNIIVDNNSALEMNLKETIYSGSINNKNEAKKIVLNIDKDSKISLTDDIYVTVINNEIEDFSNIESNGHNIYYKDNSNTKSMKLPGGGMLKPM